MTYIITDCNSWFEVVWVWMCERATFDTRLFWSAGRHPDHHARLQELFWWVPLGKTITAEGTCQRPRESRGGQDDMPSVSCRLFAHADVRAPEHTAGWGAAVSQRAGNPAVCLSPAGSCSRPRLLFRSGCSEPFRMMTVDCRIIVEDFNLKHWIVFIFLAFSIANSAFQGR